MVASIYEHTYTRGTSLSLYENPTHPRINRSCVSAHDSLAGYIHKHACTLRGIYLHMNGPSYLGG